MSDTKTMVSAPAVEAYRASNDKSVAIELDDAALTAAHLAVEDLLIDFRDARLSVMGFCNGFVVNEKDGTPSGVMRVGTRDGLRVAIRAYLGWITKESDDE